MSLAGELSILVSKTSSTSTSTSASATLGQAAAGSALSTTSLELDTPSQPFPSTMSSTTSAPAVPLPSSLSVSTSVPSSKSEVRTSIPREQMAAWSTDEPIMVDSEGVILPLPSSSATPSNETEEDPTVVGVPVTSSTVPLATTSVNGATTVFTTVPISDHATASTSTSALPTGSPQTLQRSGSSSILHPDNRLFPLGVAVTCLGGIVAMIMAGFLCFRLFHARQQRRRRMTILSFSPVSGTKHMSSAGTLTPYPFESKAWDDTTAAAPHQQQRIDYSAPAPTPALMAERVPAGRRVPSFYHAQTLARCPGIASTDTTTTARPLTRHEPNASFDAFNCAMYPAGTCPLEHEERMRSLHESQERAQVAGRQGGRGSSPVPSFQTDRQQPPLGPVIIGAGRRLTPPRIPAPAPGALVFSPSIDQWTNSVRGFTPRASASHSSGSSIYSLYVPDRV